MDLGFWERCMNGDATPTAGNVDISTAGQAAGTVFKPPRTPAKITVPKAPPPPKAPTATGPLATCTFNVAGTGAERIQSGSRLPRAH